MHTATVQRMDKDHHKHSTPNLRVCPRCRTIKWLPNQFEKAKDQEGYISNPMTFKEDGKKYTSGGFRKLELADVMQELAIIRERLRLIN